MPCLPVCIDVKDIFSVSCFPAWPCEREWSPDSVSVALHLCIWHCQTKKNTTTVCQLTTHNTVREHVQIVEAEAMADEIILDLYYYLSETVWFVKYINHVKAQIMFVITSCN